MISHLENLPTLYLLLAVMVGIVLFGAALLALLLERGKRRMVESFSDQDRALIVGLLDERVEQFGQKMVGLGQQMLDAQQQMQERVDEKFDDLKVRLIRIEKRMSSLESQTPSRPAPQSSEGGETRGVGRPASQNPAPSPSRSAPPEAVE